MGDKKGILSSHHELLTRCAEMSLRLFQAEALLKRTLGGLTVGNVIWADLAEDIERFFAAKKECKQ